MLSVDRRNRILELIRESGSVSVTMLSELFKVSGETIRRDLQRMENQGLLKRAYGGAYLGDVVRQDVHIEIRRNTYREGKHRIGCTCAELINSGDTIMLDCSSTALRIASEIKQKSNIIVITNSLDILIELSDAPDIHVISCGGDLNPLSLSFVGMTAIENLEKFNVDKAFVSCTGVSIKEGITDANEMQAYIRKRMLDSAQKRILIADYTKFGKVTLTKFADLEDVHMIVTDQILPDEWMTLLENKQIELCYPERQEPLAECDEDDDQ